MKILIDTTEENKLTVEKANKIYQYSNHKKTDQYLKFLKISEFNSAKKNIKKVEVNTGPGGYTSTRIGVAIANVINNLFLDNNKIFKPKYRKGDKGY
ncbi:hypothetical protein COY43_00710 [Candidatus Berkelbacteria bacterium CG_4_10_14_0_8_um_filter_35_9_33_8]|uniref:Gcp-like domain-containing protein n=1 Tax=Candidatus Berkelbacteria bacterium CG_4_10_14_0_2_um_filter_35_9_33_12 TaxID=1974499 RepID=A0A2M7W3G0_9BACT|nr:MAG: hypothetical protein COX10_02700 [Candidatus Berkelbacteria bacterium CG23_combo_of_CG06-09_8_20_14_all_33_15]PIS08668.1 MAG: hypothetical protein COT76_00130 [Candidatus Berkelbacteria bacterium CG10_big_fil_rev_8_21_14_0_10_33_10]PIZ28388.1 MAG: hypothetical protein COY43_00710 [Candidatus Berkelbacteria bacterium CG_4_10_14_0_8_um_filter_35_9_33_8]PJA20056.1 MAG: hypothetical protein COX60_02965 [Candidatus Berkelbacteria bacterium CG_4_10_14_0_2_um_filter_35_9_33_12]